MISAVQNPSWIKLFLPWFVIPCLLATCAGLEPWSTLRCKYSVRDVAFVNVHGKNWQLELIKVEGQSQNEFDQWNEVLRSKLATSNLGFTWHRADSPDAERFPAQGQSNELPQMILTNADGDMIPFAATGSFEARIDQLIQSPMRKGLRDALADSLCVFLLIRGDDQAKNDAAEEVIQSSINQIEKQMWMMEKASDKGPALVTVDANDDSEQLSLRSIGIDPSGQQFPVVAIIFGQARRLGDLIVGAKIEQTNLVKLASICGSDCECALDRRWLYGDQMVHDWPVELERRTENGLDFDPKSAFVIAEVAQILQKNSKVVGGGEMVNLGAGLIIHDLDQLESGATSKVDTTKSNVKDVMPANKIPASDEAPLPQILEDKVSADSVVGESEASDDIPWVVFIMLGLAVVVVAIFRMQKGGAQR